MNASSAAEYVVASLRRQHGPRFTGSRRPHAPARSAAARLALDVDTVLSDYQLYGVRAAAQEGLRGWLRGEYPLLARPDIPTPAEMLEVQCQGRRYATVMTASGDQQKVFGRHHGARAFLLHDLEHAHKFFAEPQMREGQRRFFIGLRECLAHPGWASYDEAFAAALDYVKSDMNSHPLHMFKYLKAIVLEAHRRLARQEFEATFADLVGAFGLPAPVVARINRPGVETAADQHALAKFFTDASLRFRSFPAERSTQALIPSRF